MKLYLGADHRGYELKNQLREYLFHHKHDVEDVGPPTLDEDDDYPKYAYLVATKVLGEEDGAGILICGSGQGMAIAANRIGGIRAAIAWNEDTARTAKADDNANVLVLPADFTDPEEAPRLVELWLGTKFSADPKYHRRVDELEDLYG